MILLLEANMVYKTTNLTVCGYSSWHADKGYQYPEKSELQKEANLHANS